MSKKDKVRLKELNKEIPYFQKLLSSSPNEKESYERLLESMHSEKTILEDKLVSRGQVSKGICNLSDFNGKPILTVSIDKTHNKRNLYDSVRGGWKVTEVMSGKLVEQNGYVVGVINKVVMGVVQVDGFNKEEKRENEDYNRIRFTGKLLSDHPSIGLVIKERTVSGTIQYFNLND